MIKNSVFFPVVASLHLCVFALILCFPVAAQKIAILTPDKADPSQDFAEKLEEQMGKRLNILDESLSESAYLSAAPATPFNLATEESKKIGAAIGCEFFVLLRSATQRRSAFHRAEYYESYAVIYVVSSRTGRLVFWTLTSFEAPKPVKAEKMLDDSVKTLASEIENRMHSAIKSELAEAAVPNMEEVPDDGSPAATNFRAPIPYPRIKPEYTTQANLYDIAATVDMMVDLDEKGSILRTEVVRWAGFGLDESVEKTVRSMNWRPAERNGKPLPMRFLVRYNFKKLDKD